MAWVRIDDAVMHHPKILVLSDSAFRLWIKGLCYCQTYLTDGLIPREALRQMKPRRTDIDALTTAIDTSYAPLWETVDGFGFKVHDYLFWNDSREKVRDRQVRARDRKDHWKATRNSPQNTIPERVPDAVPNDVPNTSLTKPNHNLTKPNLKEEGRAPSSRSKRPIFQGQRLVVFEWMLDDLARMLGDHTDGFDLHAWFFDLDERATLRGLVIPQRDGGQWLQAQTLDEAKRRGLPMAVAAPVMGKQSSRLLSAIANLSDVRS